MTHDPQPPAPRTRQELEEQLKSAIAENTRIREEVAKAMVALDRARSK